MNKKIKYVVIYMVLCLFFWFGAKESVWAAENVDVTQNCSLSFEIPSAYREILKSEVISVRLYQIAAITENGEYVGLLGYESLKLEELSKNSTAEQWEQKAKEAAILLQVNVWKETSITPPSAEVMIVNNYGMINQLEAGLYLVCVKPFQNGDMSYKALPYLISLPNLLETKDHLDNVIQTWNYDVVVDLKLSCTDTEDKKDEQPKTPEEIPISGEPSESIPPETEKSMVVKYKTGDDMILPLLTCSVVLLSAAFVGVCILEKISKNQKSKSGAQRN